MNVGEKIREIRKSKKMSARELSEKVGLKSAQAVLQYERGDRTPSLETLSKIAKALNSTITELLGDTSVSTVMPQELFNEIKSSIHRLGETKEVFIKLIKLNGYELIVDENFNYSIKKDATREIYSINDNKLDDLIRDTNQFLKFKIEQLIKEGE